MNVFEKQKLVEGINKRCEEIASKNNLETNNGLLVSYFGHHENITFGLHIFYSQSRSFNTIEKNDISFNVYDDVNEEDAQKKIDEILKQLSIDKD